MEPQQQAPNLLQLGGAENVVQVQVQSQIVLWGSWIVCGISSNCNMEG